METHIQGPSLNKGTVCEPILRALPAWFGIEDAIVHYAAEIDRLHTLLAYAGERVIGFVSIKQHNTSSAEIYVMGVLPEAHRQGVGRALITQAQAWLKQEGVEYVQVKTLGPSHPDEGYLKTRNFYAAMGFKPLEEFTQIWDEHNPCLIMVQKL